MGSRLPVWSAEEKRLIAEFTEYFNSVSSTVLAVLKAFENAKEKCTQLEASAANPKVLQAARNHQQEIWAERMSPYTFHYTNWTQRMFRERGIYSPSASSWIIDYVKQNRPLTLESFKRSIHNQQKVVRMPKRRH